MRNTITIFKRELGGYFATPVAYVFIVVFLGLTGFMAFYFGNFFPDDGQGQADLQRFFTFHPWLYLFLIPAISMRVWSEERQSGTIELLMTLPISTTQAVVGKFLAAWLFAGIALALTFPMWITVNYLGDPDNGVILASYAGSLFMSGAYLAIGLFISGLTRNQVISFVLSASLCLLFILAGFPAVLDFFSGWAPASVLDTVRSFSFLTHFDSITRGLIDLRDLIFFGSLMICFLLANALVIDVKKAD
jgi:ABC-2 type transport system permease protein